MATINLLPWREELRAEQQKTFINIFALSILATVLLFGLAYQAIEERKKYQIKRNEYLKAEIVKVDKKITKIEEIATKRDKLRKKIEVIEGLQASRTEIVHVFDELRRLTPEGIYLTELTQNGNKLELKGRAIAESEVAVLMEAITDSEWLALNRNGLKSMVRDEKEKESEFIIMAKQFNKKSKQKEDAAETEIETEIKTETKAE